MNELIWFKNVTYLWLLLNASWALVFCMDTHVCTISKVIGINDGKRNMFVKQRIHKWSYMRKNKYGCQM